MKIMDINQMLSYIARQAAKTDSIILTNEKGDTLAHLKGFAFEIVEADDEITPFEEQMINDEILDINEGLKDIEINNLLVEEDDIIRTQYNDIIIIDVNDDESTDYGDILFVIR